MNYCLEIHDDDVMGLFWCLGCGKRHCIYYGRQPGASFHSDVELFQRLCESKRLLRSRFEERVIQSIWQDIMYLVICPPSREYPA
jgi:hypothetical protein